MSGREGQASADGIFAWFVRSEVGGSMVLLAATALALACANSPWREAYEHLIHGTIGITWGARSFSLSVHEWVNDGLMALFFFVVGLEIKREVVVGHLSSWRLAAMPAAAALGGMLLPAAVYALFNAGGPAAHGWGIPIATDIAFALGVLALLGRRVPSSVRILLAALAIADDLGAVLVIALFYTEAIRWVALLVAGLLLGGVFVLLRGRIRRRPEVLLLAVAAVWAAVFASGVHATVAGVLVALAVPVMSPIGPQRFVDVIRRRLRALEEEGVTRRSVLLDERQLDAVFELHEAAAELRPAGMALERFLHPLQAYVVLPLFAFFNAGITVDRGAWAALAEPIGAGVAMGLLLGKPLGVTLASWLAVRSGLASLPADLGWSRLFAVSWLAGIGFTMSLFVSGLAFGGEPSLEDAKLGVLAGSLGAGLVGYLLLWRALPWANARDPEQAIR
jgi:NhaA family Na+:H+ antiporter